MRCRSLCVAALTAGLAFSAAAEAKENWVFNIFTGPTHLINEPLKEWAKEVGEATKGEVEISFLPTSAAPPPKQIDGVVSGQFDGAFIFHAFTAQRAVGPQLGILPFMHGGTAEQGSIAYWRVHQKYFGDKNEFADDGVHILSLFQFAGGHYYSGTDKPIESIDDMKQRKMWVLAGTPAKTMQNAGIDFVSGPAARLSEFTQTKVVQGLAGVPREAIPAFGALSFAKSMTVTANPIMYPSFALFVSQKKWDGLSPELQAAIMEVSSEKMAAKVGRAADVAEKEAAEVLKENNIAEVKGSKEFEDALRAAGQPLVDEWIEKAQSLGVDGNEVIAAFRAEVGTLSQ